MVSNKDWMYGYFEAEVSFGVYLNLIERKKTNYLVIKPFIAIQVKDEDVIRHIRDEFGFHTRVIEAKQKNTQALKALKIQSFQDIDRIVAFLEGHEFVSRERQRTYERFVKAYREVKRIGHIWKGWDKRIEEFIDGFLPIHENNKGFTNEEWKDRIRVHFGEVEQ